MKTAPARLLVATTNAGKLREIRRLLDGLPIRIETLADFPHIAPPEETGRTFQDNARLKALYYAAATGLPAVAEDSGLEVDALDGAPGVESARFGGTGSAYPQKFALLYERLRARGVATSPARFVCVVSMALDGEVVMETKGTIEGVIAAEPRGGQGFGYDPIFFYPPYGRTLAEVSEAEKSAVSHRGQAFRAFRDHLERLLSSLKNG
jgi:XTP/dITP diphosphohydrolase